MDSNNNNGRGIFYGVIGVATLVVAIIGATFAYFSASITRNGITNVKATTLSLEIEGEKSNFKTDLIPVETDGSNGAIFGRYIGLAGADGNSERKACKDDVGNSICSVYQFTVKNPNPTTAQTVVGSMKVSQNTFKHLYYAVFKGDDKTIPTEKYNLINGAASATVHSGAGPQGTGAGQEPSAVGTLVVPKTHIVATADQSSAPAGTGRDGVYNWSNTLETLAANGGNTTYTVVIWLEESGSDQTTEDAGMSFAAGVTFTSNTGAGGVTGVITSAG